MKTTCGPSVPLELSRDEALTLLKAIVIAYDHDRNPIEFDNAIRKARKALGFKLARPTPEGR